MRIVGKKCTMMRPVYNPCYIMTCSKRRFLLLFFFFSGNIKEESTVKTLKGCNNPNMGNIITVMDDFLHEESMPKLMLHIGR